jgi:hypothetical protein
MRVIKVTAKSDRNRLDKSEWIKTGLITAGASIVAVLFLQALAIVIWPEIAFSKPLDCYTRLALFTLLLAASATCLLAWLANHRPQPIQMLIKLAIFALIIGLTADYVLAFPGRGVLISSIMAFIQFTAGVEIVLILIVAYRWRLWRAPELVCC